MNRLENAGELELSIGEEAPDGVRLARIVTPASWQALKAGLSESQSAWIAAQGFSPAPGKLARLPDDHGAPGDVLVGAGDEDDMWAWASFAEGCPDGFWKPCDARGKALSRERNVSALKGWALARYRFSPTGREIPDTSSRLVLPNDDHLLPAVNEAAAIRWARRLIDRPGNDAGPDGLETAISELLTSLGATVDVTEGDALLAKNLPAIHAVGRAARQAPRLLDASWGASSAPKIVLIGKGVSFDTGGLNLKSAAGMRQMKRDMGGSAVTAALAALTITSKLPVNLRLLVPIVENVIGSDSFRPGDLLPTRSGKLIEVDNTDCEGRIILADCLTLALESNPDLVIDCATLTGSARTALGGEIQALFCPDDEMAKQLVIAGADTQDLIWQMPLHDGYTNRIRGSVGDVVNMAAGAYAGAITAALFLREFVSPMKSWMHLDISAWNDAKKPGRAIGGEATGLRALHAFLSRRYPIA